VKAITEILERADELQIERGKQYGNAHLTVGKLFAALFPHGVELRTEQDFAMFSTISNITMKLNRFCRNFEEGGHEDSAIDIINYAAILVYRTEKLKAEKQR